MFFNIFSIRSPLWSKTRKDFLKVNPCCSACGTKKKLQVHHIIPVHVDSTKELDAMNLIVLCKSCHFIFGHLMDWLSWNESVLEDSRVYLLKVQNRPHKLN